MARHLTVICTDTGSNPAPTQPTQTLSVHTRRWVPTWDGTAPSGGFGRGPGGQNYKKISKILND